MRAQAHNLCAKAGFPAIFSNNILINRIRIEMPIKTTRSVVCHRPEQSAFHIPPMSRQRQVILNHPLGSRVNRHEADFGPLTFDAKMHDTLSAVQVFYS
jgi:hypothetical protein